MAASQWRRFFRRFNGVLPLSFRGVDFRPCFLFLTPTRWDDKNGDDKDGDVLFAQNASTSGQFAQQRNVRMMVREAAPGGVVKSKLRCSLA